MKRLLLGLTLLASIPSFASPLEGENFKQQILQNRIDSSVYLNALALEDLSLKEFRAQLKEKMLENRREFELSQRLSEEPDANESLRDFKARLRTKVLENRNRIKTIQFLSEARDSELELFRSRLRDKLLENRRVIERY